MVFIKENLRGTLRLKHSLYSNVSLMFIMENLVTNVTRICYLYNIPPVYINIWPYIFHFVVYPLSFDIVIGIQRPVTSIFTSKQKKKELTEWKKKIGNLCRQAIMHVPSLYHMFYWLWYYASFLVLALKDTFMNLFQYLLLLLWQWRNIKRVAESRVCVWLLQCPNPEKSNDI